MSPGSAIALSNAVGLPFSNGWWEIAGKSPVTNRGNRWMFLSYMDMPPQTNFAVKSLTFSQGFWQQDINN